MARSKLIAQPMLTFLEENNPCGVLLCGPVDPLAVMHTKSSDDHDSDDGAEGCGGGSEEEEEEDEEEEGEEEGGGEEDSDMKGCTKMAGSKSISGGKTRAGRDVASPIRMQSPKGKGRAVEAETAAWDGRPVDGWPVTPSSWLRCVEKALR
jgi:hypothetical protein